MQTQQKSRMMLTLIVAILAPIFFFLLWYRVSAENVGTSVTIANSGPVFTDGPREDAISSSTSPTNAGTNVRFEGTANDPNDDRYYLAVCKSNLITAGNDAAPTCTDGDWCISTDFADETEADCSYTTQAGDIESNAWYAFVCDKVSGGGICSAASSGSGDSGSPFAVNHRPTFSAFGDTGAVAPGAVVTFQGTVADSDTDGTQDLISMFVCKANDFTGTACGGGGTYCSEVQTVYSTTISCDYTQPNPYHDEDRTAYAFIIDHHDFPASPQQTDLFSPTNVAPVVTNVQLNSGSDMTLTPNTTTSIVLSALISDDNSCQDVPIGNILGYLYRSGIGYADGGTDCGQASSTPDNNNCYADISCVADDGTDSCDSDTDSSRAVTCTVNVHHYADPTDTDTVYTVENWLDSVYAADDDGASDDTEIAYGAPGYEMESLTAFTVTNSISYGNMSAGGNSGSVDDGDTTQITTMTATGNVGLDQTIQGGIFDTWDGTMTQGGCAYSIPTGNQEHSCSTNGCSPDAPGFTYSTNGVDLTNTQIRYDLDCAKTTTATNETKDTYWGIEIPTQICSGSFTGNVTLTGVKGDNPATQW
jgi:hypothetical protein